MPGAIIKRINTENAIYLFNVMHVSIINVILVNPNNEYKIPLILLLFNPKSWKIYWILALNSLSDFIYYDISFF